MGNSRGDQHERYMTPDARHPSHNSQIIFPRVSIDANKQRHSHSIDRRGRLEWEHRLLFWAMEEEQKNATRRRAVWLMLIGNLGRRHSQCRGTTDAYASDRLYRLCSAITAHPSPRAHTTVLLTSGCRASQRPEVIRTVAVRQRVNASTTVSCCFAVSLTD